jgi:hypothetical protein
MLVAMRIPPRVIVASALCAAAACAGPGAAWPPELVLLGKCAFGGSSQTHAEPGDVYLYAVFDPTADRWSVATDVAEVRDDLRDPRVVQSASRLLPARRVEPGNLEFGDLDAAREGQARFVLAMRDRTGELHISIGGTYRTDDVYPRCAFWEGPTASE